MQSDLLADASLRRRQREREPAHLLESDALLENRLREREERERECVCVLQIYYITVSKSLSQVLRVHYSDNFGEVT